MAPRTVLKKLESKAAPFSIHQGELRTNDFTSFPIDSAAALFTCSRVMLKQSRKPRKQSEAMTIMAYCQLCVRLQSIEPNQLHNGSQAIDALVHSLTEIREGQRVIGRFAPMPFYYITYPGNEDLLREMNQGIADLKMNRPELENELVVKYYDSRLDHTILLTDRKSVV